MTPDAWLAAVWPFVEANLPSAPAGVLEIGCGPHGGFVPALLRGGYDAVGVDPEAPEGSAYVQTGFEQYHPAAPVDAIVACTSLHHVADLGEVLRRIVTALDPGGRLIVVEWARERFGESTARWCFARLAPAADGDEGGWLHRRRDEWLSSGRSWEESVRAWAEGEGLHTGGEILGALEAHFEPRSLTRGPYFFADLADTAETDEQAAIDAGEIQATGIRYTGTPRRP